LFIRYVGLDVHKESIKIAVADDGRDKARFLASIPNDSNKLLKKLHELGSNGSIQCCYSHSPPLRSNLPELLVFSFFASNCLHSTTILVPECSLPF